MKLLKRKAQLRERVKLNGKAQFTSKAMRKGSYSMSMIAIAIAIVILVNLFAGQIPEQYKKIDISPWDIYTVTDISKEFLNKLDKDVTIQIVGENGDIDERITTFIDIYASMSNHIKVKYLDPALHPSTVTELGTSAGSIYISCEDTQKSKNLTASDMIEYTLDYTYYSYVENGFDVEGQLTSAISYVTSTDNAKLYYTEGHNETSLSTTITDNLEKSNFAYESLNVTKTGTIPDDCDILFIFEPQKDISADELEILQNYLEQGGKITILFGERSVDMPNFTSLLSDYGMNLLDGTVADVASYYQNNPYAIFPKINSVTGITDELSSDAMILAYYSTGMEIGDVVRDTITVETLLQTTSSGVLVDGENQTQGVYVLGAVATETVTVDANTETITSGSLLDDIESETEDELETETSETEISETERGEGEETTTEERTAQLVVFTTTHLLNDSFVGSGTVLDNMTIFMNALTNNLDNVENISIEAKSLETTYIVVNDAIFWGALYVVVIPLTLIIIGLVTWMKRKKR